MRWSTVFAAAALVFILGVAVLIILPIGSSEPPMSKAAACMSNLKQLGLGQLMYASDYDDDVPIDAWMDRSRSYIKSPYVYRCPLVPEGSYGYAMSASLRTIPGDDSLAARLPLLFECTDLGRNIKAEPTAMPRPGRHDGKSTIGYCDGHVKAVKTP